MRKSVLLMVCLGMIPLWGQERGAAQETPPKMICPLDQTEYRAGTIFCPLDGAELVPAPQPEDAGQQILALSEEELRQMIRAELGTALAPYATKAEVARMLRQQALQRAAEQKAAQQKKGGGGRFRLLGVAAAGCVAYLFLLMIYGP